MRYVWYLIINIREVNNKYYIYKSIMILTLLLQQDVAWQGRYNWRGLWAWRRSRSIDFEIRKHKNSEICSTEQIRILNELRNIAEQNVSWTSLKPHKTSETEKDKKNFNLLFYIVVAVETIKIDKCFPLSKKQDCWEQ